MAVISGKDGTVSFTGGELVACMDWRLVDLSENKDFHSNDSGAARQRVEGVHDSNGTFTLHDYNASALAGSGGEFIGYTNQDIYTVTVIIDQVEVVTDMNTGDIVAWTVTFSGNGEIVHTTGSL